MNNFIATVTAPVTGNTDLDTSAVVLVTAIAALGVLAGAGSGIKAAVAIFGKVMKYFRRTV